MKKTTLKDVAERAGVSKATVSYILNNSNKPITEETKARVKKAMEELNYVPDLGAASLTNKTSKMIGVVIPQTEPGSQLMFHNSFYSEIISSIEYYARKIGYHILISGTNVDESYIKHIYERNLDAVIAIGVYPDEFFDQFKKIGIPAVLIDSYCKDEGFHNIRIDDELGGYLATKYMLDKHHKKVGFLSGKMKEDGVIKKRHEGYKRALSEYGIRYDKDLIFEGEVDFDSGIEIAERIVRDTIPVTGIVTTADVLAIGAIKGFHNKGKNVPADYSVVGFDDLEISKYITPGLTTIKQDIYGKGRLAVEILSRSLEDKSYPKQDIIIPFELIERESVRELQ
ncbi:transcriptional regulator, LacI family [Butyrivibrio proteoclasticus]|uniref:Transcriptional regulator, LacI family n=1 Tax=Butyrivibrio proteoclasticus TaxID=43305 RepID=A0A1I5XC75_9FIRM|nr:LacI family DNA-binding transcriptional regulator [Butyrivibrio proteoclasticus]SFQ29583.1 transcriptional regulator, LacI family [Butyrivibrio proteoclasticus]